MSNTTLLWHDYETWGLNPRADRPSQFAAIRTDLDLNPIGEPIELFCKPAADFIPHPQSALITGLAPQRANEKGIIEAEFAQQIFEAFSVPGTCGVGYNSIRFDDEVTRFHLYRNFYDPYTREWQNGNSRWDIVDLVRMCYALRPEGINWPEREPGIPSFRLEDLSLANDIEHGFAHDALSDVHATIGLAKRIKQTQGKLFNYYFGFRRKAAAVELLNMAERPALLHISGMYPSTQGCIAPVMPLCSHPRNKNEIIVFDLRQSPFQLFNLDAKEIGETLFTKKDALPEGFERVALKGVHINKSPALAPLSTLTPELAEKWAINLKQVKANRDRILYFDGLETKIHQIYKTASNAAEKQDADSGLYQGFITRDERNICNQVLSRSHDELISWVPPFQDERLQTIYPRYLARNWPQLLDAQQNEIWQDYLAQKLIHGDHGCQLTLEGYANAMKASLNEAETDEQHSVLEQLDSWVNSTFKQLISDQAVDTSAS